MRRTVDPIRNHLAAMMSLRPGAATRLAGMEPATARAERRPVMQDIVESFRALSDEQLLAEGPPLLERERMATTVVVAWLAEVQARTLHVALGFPSLRDYCTEHLHMSEGAAYRRIRAARAALQFPRVLERLADGSVSLTAVSLLAPSMTE